MADGLVRRVLLAALFFAGLPPGEAAPEVLTWDGEAGDSVWQTALNWNPNRVPTSSDDVIIDLPGEYTVIVHRYPWPIAATVSVEAAGATLQINGQYGTTALEVQNGLTNAGTLELINPSGSFRNVAVLVYNGTLINTGTINVPLGGAGGGGRNINAAMDNQGTINIGIATTIRWNTAGAHVNGGTINVTGGNLTIDLDYGGAVSSFTNTGTCNIAAGQTLNIDGGTFTNFGSQTLTGGIYNVAGTFKFNGADIVHNGATIVLDGPASQIVDESDGDALAGFAANEASGSFTITNGRDLTTPGALDNAGVMSVGAGSTLTVTSNLTQTSGAVTLNDGTVVTGLLDVQGGTLRGNGTVTGNVTVADTVAAGLSAGRLAITGDLTLAATSTVVVEIGGPDPGNEFDVLEVSGSAALDGALSVVLINDYIPPVGTEFDVITANPRIGEFLTHNLPLVFGGSCLGAQYRSNSVTLVALAGTTITTQPQSQEICEGDPVTFSVAAEGSMPFDYQWRRNGVDIDGATGSSYTIASVTSADAGGYDVVVTNYCGFFDNSAVATLTVHTTPVVTQQPASETVCEGDPVTFTADATGTPAPDLQWYKDGELLPGETGTTLTIVSVAVADAGSYRVEATNSCGIDGSAPANLTVLVPGPGDYELDCDVDLGDFAHWPGCVTGPDWGGGPFMLGCNPFDVNFDGAIDLQDFSVFQRAMEGP